MNASFSSRMIRAARLDVALYEEVEADAGATLQALTVIVLSSVAAGLTAWGSASAIAFNTVVALVGWYLWALTIYLIGTKLLPEPATRSDLGELLRVTGFAATPGLLRVVGVVPGLAVAVALVAGVWTLVAMIIAIRQALDYRSTVRALLVAAIGWVCFFMLGGLLGRFVGPPL